MNHRKVTGNFGINIPAGRVKPSRRMLAAALSLAAGFCLLSAPVPAADWPVFRGNNARTGYISEQAYPPLTKAWDFQLGGDIMSSPVIVDGVVYIGSRAGTIYALNARTGAVVWQCYTGGWIGASPAVSGDIVYVPSMDGWLYALDRLGGSIVWKAEMGSSSVSSPLVSGGRVFLGAGMPGKELLVFDAATGSRISEYAANQPVDGAPAAYGNGIYFGANDGRIYALNGDSLAPIWPAPGYYQTIGSFGANAVALSSGALYALPGRDEKKVLRLDALTGAQLNASDPIEASDSWELTASPIAARGRVYFTAGAAGVSLYALDSQTLQPVSPAWPAPALGAIAGFGILSSPAMANEIIYAATTDGRLVAVSSSGVSAAADVNISSPAYSSPAVSNGMVFIATAGGKLIAYSAAKQAAISSPRKDVIVNGSVPVRGYIVNPNITGYTLEYGAGAEPSSWTSILSSSTLYSVEGGTLAYWDTGALSNGLYTLKLTVLESPATGTDNTALLTVRANAVPLAPSGFTAADVPGDSGNRIQLGWTPSATSGLVSCRIYRDIGDGFSLLVSTDAGAVSYIDAAAVTGTTFTYSVRAYDGYVESAGSDPASACAINDTGDNIPPAAISDLRAEAGSPGAVRLLWTAPGNDGNLGVASRYLIRCSSAAGYDWNDFNGASLYGSTVAVEASPGDDQSAEISGLMGGASYYCAIMTEDFVPNLSPLSNIASSYAALDLVPPLPPSDLAASDTPDDGGGSLTLSWTLSPDDGGGAGDVYGYKIYRRLQDSAYASSAPYASVSKGITAYSDPAAAAGVKYYYSAAAFDSTNNSPVSNEAYGVSADNWRFFDSAQGGTIRLADGTEIVIPADAAQGGSFSLLVTKLDPQNYQPLFRAKANTAANPTGITYAVKFQNSATQLIKPARITLPYTDAAVTGMDQDNLRMYAMSGGAWTLLNTSSADTGGKKVSAETLTLSTFTIMEYVPSGALLSGESVYTYPNPAKGDTVTFKFYLAEKAYVAVDVYNVAGEKVARLEKPNCPAGIVSELAWNIKNIASGVYQYKLEARSAAGTKSIMKRLAVIH